MPLGNDSIYGGNIDSNQIFYTRCVQYLLYTPLLVKAVHAQWFGGSDLNNFSLHMLLLAACRLLVNQIGITLSRLRYLSSKYEIQKKGITFASVDLSHNWYISIYPSILQLIKIYCT